MYRSSTVTFLSVGFLVVVVYLLSSTTVLVNGWPGGSAMYECCCPEHYGCSRNCFMCRNQDFFCNCDLCSCYLDSDSGFNEINPGVPSNELLRLLLRNGAGGKSRNWRFSPGR